MECKLFLKDTIVFFAVLELIDTLWNVNTFASTAKKKLMQN